MFAIQPVNKFYNNRRFVGINSDTMIPFVVYEGNANFPTDIYDFGSEEAALAWLENFIRRDNIDVMKLTISQVTDIALVNNANHFDIIEYEVVDNKINILNTYPQNHLDRDCWYKG